MQRDGELAELQGTRRSSSRDPLAAAALAQLQAANRLLPAEADGRRKSFSVMESATLAQLQEEKRPARRRSLA